MRFGLSLARPLCNTLTGAVAPGCITSHSFQSTMVRAATTTIDVYITFGQQDAIYHVHAEPGASLLSVVARSCAHKLGIPHNTPGASLPTMGLVITAGTTNYNGSFLTDPADTGGYYAEGGIVHVNIRTLGDHMQIPKADKNALWDKQVSAVQ